MFEGEVSRASPRSAHAHQHHIPAGTLHGSCEIQIVFWTREAMEENDGWKRPFAARSVHHRIHAHAMGGHAKRDEMGGVVLVRRRVCRDGRRNRCREATTILSI